MNNKSTIAIIGAMDCEINTLKTLLTNIETVKHGDSVIYIGKIESYKIILSKSGEGKVNAAINTQYIIDFYNPDYIINTGIAGGVAKDLNVGDIVIADRLVQHDFDATALGYPKGYICNGIKSTEPTYFYSDEFLINKFRNVTKELSDKTNIHIGTIATGDMFISSSDKKDELRELFNATAAEMEGAAIAHTATKNNIPFVIVRAISDLADGTAQKSLEEVETTMAEFAASIIKRFFTE